MSGPKDQYVLLFDGVCNLCNASVVFVLKHERTAQIRFASLQSDAAKKLLLQHKYKFKDLRSILFIEGGEIYERSEAVLRISGHLKYPWRLAKVFRVLPRNWLDRAYDLIADNRYRWFGKKESCTTFLPEHKNRFIQ